MTLDDVVHIIKLTLFLRITYRSLLFIIIIKKNNIEW